MQKVTIDLITIKPDGAHVLVLVEEGHWTPVDVDSQLRRQPVEEFFARFSEHIKASAEVRADIDRKRFISRLDFEFNWRSSSSN